MLPEEAGGRSSPGLIDARLPRPNCGKSANPRLPYLACLIKGVCAPPALS